MSHAQEARAKGILSEEQRKNYANVFVELDSNADGWLSREESSRWIRGMGLALSNTQLEAIFRLIDINQDGRITYDEFLLVMELAHVPPTKNTIAEDMFKMMDKDGDGYLTEEELSEGLRESGYNLNQDQIHKFATNLDRNGDGKICFEEFLQAFE